MSPIEIAAAICGLLCVIFTVRQSLWCWPTGLVQVALYIFVFYDAKLYSDVGLQVVYVVLQVYGWWHWARGGPRRQDDLPVTGLSWAARAAWLGLTILGALALGAGAATWTDAALPYPDAFITTLSLVAQWLLGRKRWESWLGWIAVDLVAIPAYASKDLLLTAALYAVFLVLAIAGLRAWTRDLVMGSSSGNSSLRPEDISSSWTSPGPTASG